jgi:alkylhydroperoxidase family enzyme
MPRPPQQPGTSEFTAAEDLAAYELLIARYRRDPDQPADEVPVSPYFGALLNAPTFAAALGRLGTLVRTAGDREGTYSHLDRELVDQVLSPYLGTNVVMKTHVPDALAVGVRLEAIDALRAGRDDDLTDDERLLARYIRQVVDGSVDDATFDAIEARLGTRGLVEYTIFVALLQLIMRLYQAFGLPDPSDEEIDELIRQFREGERELPDYRLRIQ